MKYQDRSVGHYARDQITSKVTDFTISHRHSEPETPKATTQQRSIILMLPVELLHHIFEVLHMSFEREDSLELYRLPSELRLVCQIFNRVALSTPLLWSYLRIDQKTNLAHLNERIQTMSGSLPLHISIDLMGMSIKAFHMLTHSLSLGAPRWKWLRIWSISGWIHLLGSFLGSVQTPWLVYLALGSNHSFHRGVYYPSLPNPGLTLSYAPKLQTLRIIRSDAYFSHPSRSLQHLTLIRFSMPLRFNDILNLQHCHLLRSLAIEKFQPQDQLWEHSPTFPDTSVLLRSLESLSVDGISFFHALALLGFISAPKLSSVWLRISDEYHTAVGEAPVLGVETFFMETWRCRFPKLERLQLHQ